MPAINKKNIIITIHILVLSAATIILFGNVILDLFNHWMRDDNYSHGFLVVPIVLFMIWNRKEQLSKVPPKPNRLGFLVIVLGMILFFISNIAAELFLMRSSIIVTVLGICLFYLGSRFTNQIIVPLAYLIFMIPIPSIVWNKIAFPLQLMSSQITALVIQSAGIPIMREGNILYLPNATLEVVNACSGLRSLTSLLALSAAFAYITKLSCFSKWTLFVSAIPIAILSNIFRLTFTAFIARYFGQEKAQGFLHDLSGILVFAVSIVLFYFLYQILKKREKDITITG